MFESGDSVDFTFKINEDYAQRFEHNKKREDLHRLQEKYGKDLKQLDKEEDSSSGSDEDDDAVYDSVSKDKAFLTVLSKLKSKDPDIYDKEKVWFADDGAAGKMSKKEKPIFLKDYERETLLTKGSLVVDSDEDIPADPTYLEEQVALKEDLKSALDSAAGEGEEVLTIRAKSSQEKEKEDHDYRDWLKGEKAKLKDKSLRNDCGHLQKAWTDPNLDENEKFLRDFLLNKGWTDDKGKDFVPTYDEIINDDDEEFERHETFERQFNFRFEEPDHELIKNYPRTIANSVRKSNEARKEKRKKKSDRKLKEKEERKQEIERLKKLKLEEIESKLQRLTENAGTDVKTMLGDKLEDDFNPEEHDKVMSMLFDESYYHDGSDVKKPVFSDSEDDLINDEVWFNKIVQQNKAEEAVDEQTLAQTEEQTLAQTHGQTHIHEGDGEIDQPTVIYRGDEEDDDEDRTRKKSWKRKRSKKFKEAVIKEKPKFNPDDGPFEKYFDEYYQLDCEDTIGDTKCRFGYRKTTPSSYGLTVDEILMADDKELNQWYSFKKMMKYRTPEQEDDDGKKFKNKSHNEFMKRHILKSLFPEEHKPEPQSTAVINKKRKKDISQKKDVADLSNDDACVESVEQDADACAESVEQDADACVESVERDESHMDISSGATFNVPEAQTSESGDSKSVMTQELVGNELEKTGDKPRQKKKKKKTGTISSGPQEKHQIAQDAEAGPQKTPSRNSKTKKPREKGTKTSSTTGSKKRSKAAGSISQSRLEAYGIS